MSKTSPAPTFSIDWKHDTHCTRVLFLSQLHLNHKHVYIFLSYIVRLSSHLHWLCLQAEIPVTPFDSRQVAKLCCPPPFRDMTASGTHTVFYIEDIQSVKVRKSSRRLISINTEAKNYETVHVHSTYLHDLFK
jgi:hypothetical protein